MCYVTVARSLKTYGVTFFLVKEKMKGKNKLTPRLLGVTKDSVLRLDEKSKEILKTWPLTTVRRWAASPNTFTLGRFRASYHLSFSYPLFCDSCAKNTEQCFLSIPHYKVVGNGPPIK